MKEDRKWCVSWVSTREWQEVLLEGPLKRWSGKALAQSGGQGARAGCFLCRGAVSLDLVLKNTLSLRARGREMEGVEGEATGVSGGRGCGVELQGGVEMMRATCWISLEGPGHRLPNRLDGGGLERPWLG